MVAVGADNLAHYCKVEWDDREERPDRSFLEFTAEQFNLLSD